jgi:hypothetical protein
MNELIFSIIVMWGVIRSGVNDLRWDACGLLD